MHEILKCVILDNKPFVTATNTIRQLLALRQLASVVSLSNSRTCQGEIKVNQFKKLLYLVPENQAFVVLNPAAGILSETT